MLGYEVEEHNQLLVFLIFLVLKYQHPGYTTLVTAAGYWIWRAGGPGNEVGLT